MEKEKEKADAEEEQRRIPDQARNQPVSGFSTPPSLTRRTPSVAPIGARRSTSNRDDKPDNWQDFES